MPNDWQGVDLTTVVTAVAHKHHERLQAEAIKRGFEPGAIKDWDDLSRNERRRAMEAVVPLVTDTIDVALPAWNGPLLNGLEKILSDYELSGQGFSAAERALEQISALTADARNGFQEV